MAAYEFIKIENYECKDKIAASWGLNIGLLSTCMGLFN